MSLSKKDFSDVMKLLVYGIGARILGFIAIFLLARTLSIDHFAWWQLAKTASSYVLIAMEAGFFFHIGLLIQRDGFSVKSVQSQTYAHRTKIAAASVPFFFAYTYFTDIPIWYPLTFIPFFIVSVFDYDGIAIATQKSVETGIARLLKNGLTVIVIACLGAVVTSPTVPVLAATIGATGSALLLYSAIKRSKSFCTGMEYRRPLLASISDSKHYLVTQITQTSMQSADLMIAGVFLATKDLAHYSVALLVAELAVFPSYMIQRVIQSRYIRQPDVILALKLALITITLTLVLHALHFGYFLPIYKLLFPNFDHAMLHSLVNVLLIYVAIRVANIYVQLHLNSTDFSHLVSKATSIGAFTNILGNLICIPNFGLKIIPWMTVASEAVVLSFLLFQIIARGKPNASKA